MPSSAAALNTLRLPIVFVVRSKTGLPMQRVISSCAAWCEIASCPRIGVEQRVVVEDVAPDDVEVAVDAVEVLRGAGREVVVDGDRRSGRQQIANEVRTDEAGAAGYEHLLSGQPHGV